MRVLLINSVCGTGSTGRICADIAKQYISGGDEAKIAYGRLEYAPEDLKQNSIRIGSSLDVKLHAIKTRITDKHGLGSVRATKKFLKWADEYNPDLLWLHNLHGYYINYALLFDWIKSRPDMQVKWTLHDCWSFTGHCTYFDIAHCDKWKTHCQNCPQKTGYPKSVLFDNSSYNFDIKKECFTGVKSMTLITPSDWLKNLAKQSFLGEYQIETKKNKIDELVFKPTDSNFLEQYGVENKKMVLGVASEWDERKGLDDFVKLSGMLDENYVIVLVGVTEKQKAKMPKNVLCLEKTNSKKQLAEIYTAADVFVNFTYEDTSSCVNLEAQACGTPVITYGTGGCPETIYTDNSRIVKTGDIRSVYDLIVSMNGKR